MTYLTLCARIAAAWTICLALSIAAAAQERKPRAFTVTTPDGITISAQEWGNPQGLEIVLIHGFSQSHLSWIHQVDSELAKEFRIVTYDLRGHGNSGKPLERFRYQDSKLWADELKAVMDAAGLRRPVLVGWSYAGRVMSDYIRVHGTDRIAGLNYVNAASKTDPAFFGPAASLGAGLLLEDLGANIAATRTFLRACFEKQPTAQEFETMLAFNMMVPMQVRAFMGGRPLDIDNLLRGLKLPVLVTHGEKDQLTAIAMSRHTANTIPGARLSLYPDAGHSPFFEEPGRFNAELAAFVREAHRGGNGRL